MKLCFKVLSAQTQLRKTATIRLRLCFDLTELQINYNSAIMMLKWCYSP